MIIVNIEQRSEAWHQVRLGRFTGSTFADIMAGLSTATYENAIAKVVGEIITGEEEEEGYTSPAMERGIDLEDEAACEYELLTGIETSRIGFVTPDEDDALYEWVGVSPDRFAGEGLLEIKCPLINTHLKYLSANQLPNKYRWQIQGQLMVTKKPFCDFFSYHPKMTPFIIRVYPDEKMFGELRERLLLSIDNVKQMIRIYNSYEAR